MGSRGDESAYIEYLAWAKRIIDDWAAQCGARGIHLEQLPALIGRPQSSVPKLLDECLWVVVTRGVGLDNEAAVRKWDHRLGRR
jgi:hypothetical protein